MTPRDMLPRILDRVEAAAREIDTADALCDTDFCRSFSDIAVSVNMLLADTELLIASIRDTMGGERTC